MYDFLLVYFSNFVPCDLETQLRGHSRSSKMIPVDVSYTTSY